MFKPEDGYEHHDYSNDEANYSVIRSETGTYVYATVTGDWLQMLGPYLIPGSEGRDLTGDEEDALYDFLNAVAHTLDKFYRDRYDAELQGPEWTYEEFTVSAEVPDADDETEEAFLTRAFDLVWPKVAKLLNEHDRGTFGSEYAPRLVWEYLGKPTI